MEWIDTNQQTVYQEEQQKWQQQISWKEQGVIWHCALIYAYEDDTFHITMPYEAKGAFEVSIETTDLNRLKALFEDSMFAQFLAERKVMYEQLKPLIFIHNWQLENIQLVSEKMYQKEVSFSVEGTLYFQVFFQKQIDWSLDEIILAFGSHKIRHVFSDTSIEDKIEQQIRLVIFN